MTEQIQQRVVDTLSIYLKDIAPTSVHKVDKGEFGYLVNLGMVWTWRAQKGH